MLKTQDCTEDLPIHPTHEAKMKLTATSAFFHEVFKEWICDPKMTIAYGRWKVCDAITSATPAHTGVLA